MVVLFRYVRIILVFLPGSARKWAPPLSGLELMTANMGVGEAVAVGVGVRVGVAVEVGVSVEVGGTGVSVMVAVGGGTVSVGVRLGTGVGSATWVPKAAPIPEIPTIKITLSSVKAPPTV
jgi:hypothetical protein